MKKIISLFERDFAGDPSRVLNRITAGAEWVAAGEGVATRKWDGTAVMILAGKLFARFDAKNGKTPPPDFTPAQDPDPITGHWPGWIPVGNNPNYKWHRRAFERIIEHSQKNDVPLLLEGTFELIGPHFQGNPEKRDEDTFILHGTPRLDVDGQPPVPRTFDELREWFRGRDIEGIVWHHPDGRMVKIKKSDFGLKRGD